MKTILVIEDQPDMRENIATILEMENHTVIAAQDGRAGITLAKEEKPDLILCDVMMPDMDGHEVLALCVPTLASLARLSSSSPPVVKKATNASA